jgi:hypothetical protein
MRSCRRDRSQSNWAIDGPSGSCGAGSTGLTTVSLRPAPMLAHGYDRVQCERSQTALASRERMNAFSCRSKRTQLWIQLR